jgi:hypothetical protein
MLGRVRPSCTFISFKDNQNSLTMRCSPPPRVLFAADQSGTGKICQGSNLTIT